MINEKEEFAAYTGEVSNTAKNKKDRTWLGRFTFDMLKEFEGMARVLTILARGYMWEGDEPDCDRARRALCAWCSTPESKNASSQKKSWQDRYSFLEYHKEFPELVDDKGRGWLSRHVKALCKFAKDHASMRVMPVLNIIPMASIPIGREARLKSASFQSTKNMASKTITGMMNTRHTAVIATRSITNGVVSVRPASKGEMIG